MRQTVKVGDPIIYHPGFGGDPPVLVKVEGMQVTDEPHEKYGVDRDEVSWSMVIEGRICFSLDNGHWSYSDQIVTEIPSSVLRDIIRLPKKDLPTHLGRHPVLDTWIGERLADLEEEERLDHDD